MKGICPLKFSLIFVFEHTRPEYNLHDFSSTSFTNSVWLFAKVKLITLLCNLTGMVPFLTHKENQALLRNLFFPDYLACAYYLHS